MKTHIFFTVLIAAIAMTLTIESYGQFYSPNEKSPHQQIIKDPLVSDQVEKVTDINRLLHIYGDKRKLFDNLRISCLPTPACQGGFYQLSERTCLGGCYICELKPGARETLEEQARCAEGYRVGFWEPGGFKCGQVGCAGGEAAVTECPEYSDADACPTGFTLIPGRGPLSDEITRFYYRCVRNNYVEPCFQCGSEKISADYRTHDITCSRSR